ncbi:ABC transporter permease [Undibacterium sp. RTI2.1]|nr:MULTISPECIES: ABC transporter permease [unclassified Undibacterium]MEB0031408.1 ABC transporter permease [Undibacterium sp. RTI2.1]MEB0117761.1 ABC transporter permease [Undibacterium sp. RTI2.2]MEB0233017.1 ABC transporter permease [Undibacterium sp. 10I3]
MQTLTAQLQALRTPLELPNNLHWDLRDITALDHIGAQILWQIWGKKRPADLQLQTYHEGLFVRLEEVCQLPVPHLPKERWERVSQLGTFVLSFVEHGKGLTILLGQLILDLFRLIRHPLQGPWKEISANLYRTGFQALGITALVGFLIGIVLSYLSAQQLRAFGGELYIVNILGMSIVRELGPLLAAILVAGRSGSAITAQLGVMRVTEELDAMRVMGIPHGYRLIMPRVIALAIAMPLLVIWTDVMALAGGMLAAQSRLGMSPTFFLYKLPEAVALINYWIGMLKGVTFGILIALVACHFGLRIKPNTESLGQGTTSSVVISITIVIIADAIFAILFSKSGYY